MKKEEKAGFLFEEIGNVDDAFLAESSDDALLRLQTKKSRLRALRGAVLIAAAAALLAALAAIGAMLARNRLNAPHDIGGETTAATKETESPQSGEIEFLSEDADLFDGCAAVYFTVGDGICRRKIDAQTLKDLMDLAREGGETVSESMRSRKKIWLADGRGGVYSPHLRWSGGNAGAGELYEYDQEIVLNNKLRRALYALTGENFNE